jgi:hypothetical protein
VQTSLVAMRMYARCEMRIRIHFCIVETSYLSAFQCLAVHFSEPPEDSRFLCAPGASQMRADCPKFAPNFP